VASYKLEIKPSAAKELESLGTKKDCEKIVARINALASDPRPSGSEKLAGRQNSYRIRQGNDLIILDGRVGRREAQRLNWTATGSLGVLPAGSKRGMIPTRRVVQRLRQTTFSCRPKDVF